MKATIKILRIILTVLLCAIILLNGWMLFQQAVLKREAPEFFGYSQYIVTSGSMEPSFSPGDMILVKKQEEYGLGDVVTFRGSGGETVTHRIVGSVSGQFITQGDANNTEDSDLLPPESILGKLQLVLPGVGDAILFFRSPFGLLILLAAGVLIIKLPDWVGALRSSPRGKHAE